VELEPYKNEQGGRVFRKMKRHRRRYVTAQLRPRRSRPIRPAAYAMTIRDPGDMTALILAV
jgi:hypothetical protein